MKKNLFVCLICLFCLFIAGCAAAHNPVSASRPEDAAALFETNIGEPDFNTYMRNLQTKVKENWEPPKGTKSTRVVLLFKVDKKGNILNPKVLKSGGEEYDKAALEAVKKSSPFEPLPKEYKGKTVEVQFSLDYNVWNRSAGKDNKWEKI